VKRRHVREDDHLDDAEDVVVRGGELDAEVLRTDAVRNHDIYGFYGISVFALRGLTLDEMAQQVPLVRFDRLTVMKAAPYARPVCGSSRRAATADISMSASTSSTPVSSGYAGISTRLLPTRTMKHERARKRCRGE
jgi:hypothetical protein